jgi:predicted nucleic acid binding AN1-type Zn finger protein
MRCQHPKCNKKLSLIDKQIKCKCNNVFCVKHRLSENHNCSYDYSKDKVTVTGCKKAKVIKI